MSAPLRWAMVGVSGYLARVALPGMADAVGAQLVAIAARDPRAAEAKLDDRWIPLLRDTPDTVLARDDVDAVYLTVPNGLHADWTVRAVEAGKHVLCEKPLAVRAADVRTVAAAAARHDRLVVDGYMHAFHPQWSAARELVTSGRIGELMSVTAEYAYLDSDYEGPRFSAELDGGTLNMVGCHVLRAIVHLFGEPPRTVSAFARYVPGHEVDRSIAALLQFGGGLAAFVASVEAYDSQRVQIKGTRGVIDVPLPINAMAADAVELTVETAEGRETVPIAAVDQFRLEMEAFARAVAGRASGDPSPLAEAGTLAATLEALAASARAGGAPQTVEDVARA